MPATLDCRRCSQPFHARRSDAMFCLPCREARAKERAAEYDTHHREPCPRCGRSMVRRAKLCKPCDNQTRSFLYLGENNPNWRMGRTMSSGYVRIRVTPDKIASKAYRLEHHVVWEQHSGKPLPKGWVVHHLNGVKDDNRPENLAAMPRNEHHTHPREALRPYEARIRELEQLLTHTSSHMAVAAAE